MTVRSSMCDLRAKATCAAKVSGSGGRAHHCASVAWTSRLQANGLPTPSLIAKRAPPSIRKESQQHAPSGVGMGRTLLEWNGCPSSWSPADVTEPHAPSSSRCQSVESPTQATSPSHHPSTRDALTATAVVAMAPKSIDSHSATTLANCSLVAANASGHGVRAAPRSASCWLTSAAA